MWNKYKPTSLTISRVFPVVLLLFALLLTLYVTVVRAQQATVTLSVPTLPQNVAQWSGTSVTTAAALSDTSGNPTAPLIGSAEMLWDTAQWARHKGTALASFPTSQTLTSRNLIGGAIAERSSRWSVIHNPAAGTQATASIAAEGSVRHIIDCISFSAGSVVAPALTALTVNVRDGATGAGTIIWTHEVVISNATGQNAVPFSTCGLNLPATTNTALTGEWSAGLANLTQAVNISGWNVQ